MWGTGLEIKAMKIKNTNNQGNYLVTEKTKKKQLTIKCS